MKDFVMALTGGVGGAKLCLGLARYLSYEQVEFVVNTGDDFEYLGLSISPDLDTLMYTLAGVADTDTGWGRAAESWQFMAALKELGAESWFKLGDRDLAVHVLRSKQRRGGQDLSAITQELCAALGVKFNIWPMSNDRVRTVVHTAAGALAFQDYFVRQRCAPAVTGFEFQGAQEAQLLPQVAERLHSPNLRGVIICPSNPFLSVGPMLALSELRALLLNRRVPVVAISPIVGGQAIKGPSAKMMDELGIVPSALTVAQEYQDFIDGFVLDVVDADLRAEVESLGLVTVVRPTVMITLADRIAVARDTLEFIDALQIDEQ